MTGMHIQMRRRISSPNGRQKHERNMETDTDIFNLDEEKMIILITGASHTSGPTIGISVGEGEKTLVLMAASGTVCPSLDFKNLYSSLGDDYRIVTVEKFGYGYSDIVNRPRDIATILSDTRAALSGAGISGSYILCPHSYSGLEALYWAQTYPDEVEAIIGLDMAFPDAYNYTKGGALVEPYYLVQNGLINLGIGRFFSDDTFLPEGDFLSETEEKIYIALVNRIGNNIDVAKEASAAKDSAEQVASGDKPDIPMLLFLSEKKLDGSNELWKGIAYDYAEDLNYVSFSELNCGHYIFHYEPERIAEEIKAFLKNVWYAVAIERRCF